MEKSKLISIFNICWQEWVKGIQTQIPSIRDDLDNTLNVLYTVSINDPDKPMFLFQEYTAPYLSLMVAKDETFFQEMSLASGGNAIPLSFYHQFTSLSENDKVQIWSTLSALTSFVCQIYPEYNALMNEATKKKG